MASPDRLEQATEPPGAAPGSWPPARTPTRSSSGGAGRGSAGPAGSGPAGRAGRRPAANARAAGTRRQATTETDDVLRELVGGFAQAFLEVEVGRRPRRQLSPVVSVELAARLAPLRAREGSAPGRVIRVCGSRATRDRYEAVVVVARGERYGGLAVSLARRRGRWLVVEAARPEDSRSATPAAHDPASSR